MLADSITEVDDDDAHAVVVTGSHGGVSAGAFALAVPLRAVVFNDAGIGKDDAGVAALAILQRAGVAAATVSHTSARIGDARDTWESGVVSRVNDLAGALGVAPGATVRSSAALLSATGARSVKRARRPA